MRRVGFCCIKERRTVLRLQRYEALDGDIVMLSAHWERKMTSLTQLHEQLQSLPAFISDLDAITANIAHLEGDFEEMESRLVYLEALCLQCEQQTAKQQHINQSENYKKKKRRELELLEEELGSEHAQKVAELELVMQQKLRERQKVYEEAFNQDVEKYLSTGYLQNREPAGADVCSLDQVTLTNISDQEALDDFLNSSGDEVNTESSLTSGPDLTRCSSESSNQTSPPNDQLSNKDVFWQPEEELASQESDELLVQSDEEDIHPDMALVGLHDVGTLRGSDDSDSSGDLRTGTYALGKA
ncbi:dysbindin-A isoform X3 [Pelmatolapia mariae]|uniref:dysbindin-A isoform X3 n=1 Tax=Pelmatolapia mariae TaxID=158779 RepID=UPI002FE67192